MVRSLRLGRGTALTLLICVLAACSTPQTAQLVQSPGAIPTKAEVAGLPFYPQEQFYCGPAALATVLAWTGAPISPNELASQVYTPDRKGSLRNDIIVAARRNGRIAVPVKNLSDLATEIAAGHPVLVFQNLALDWYPQWHFAVAIGYDLERKEIALRSGREPRRIVPLGTFERTWRRGDYWALVVLKPDTLPASADLISVLRAAAGLERAGRHSQAATAYAAVLSRWPDSFAAFIGLGNVRYAESKLVAAETAFRKAIKLEPLGAEAWNNLAHVLAAQGRQTEAVAAAREAIRLSPNDQEPYLHTIREISKS